MSLFRSFYISFLLQSVILYVCLSLLFIVHLLFLRPLCRIWQPAAPVELLLVLLHLSATVGVSVVVLCPLYCVSECALPSIESV